MKLIALLALLPFTQDADDLEAEQKKAAVLDEQIAGIQDKSSRLCAQKVQDRNASRARVATIAAQLAVKAYANREYALMAKGKEIGRLKLTSKLDGDGAAFEDEFKRDDAAYTMKFRSALDGYFTLRSCDLTGKVEGKGDVREGVLTLGERKIRLTPTTVPFFAMFRCLTAQSMLKAPLAYDTLTFFGLDIRRDGTLRYIEKVKIRIGEKDVEAAKWLAEDGEAQYPIYLVDGVIVKFDTQDEALILQEK